MKIRLAFFLLTFCLASIAAPLEAEHKTLNIAQGYIAADILPLWVAKEPRMYFTPGFGWNSGVT